MKAQTIEVSIHKYKIQLNTFTSTVDIKQVFITYSEISITCIKIIHNRDSKNIRTNSSENAENEEVVNRAQCYKWM